jgi:hypothetical protein
MFGPMNSLTLFVTPGSAASGFEAGCKRFQDDGSARQGHEGLKIH